MAEYWNLNVSMTPQNPGVNDLVNVTVSFTFGCEPPYVEEFSPVHVNGNIFSINVTVYLLAPGEYCWTWVHTDSHTYSLANISAGEYEFRIYVETIHWNEGYWLEETVPFTVSIVVPNDYPTIQEAINNAEDGNTIIIRGGIYNEWEININKPLCIMAEPGFNVTLQEGFIIFHVLSSDVLIQGINFVNITKYGVNAHSAGSGPQQALENVGLINNSFLGLGSNGFYSYNSYNATIRYNLFEGISTCSYWGAITFNNSQNGKIEGNIIKNCQAWVGGIILCCKGNHTVVRNTIQGNTPYGIRLSGSDNNIIYHNNFINNTNQVYSTYSYNNTWDNGCEGNYWSNYNGTDLNGDGIGDTELPWEGVDYYPLMNLYWNPGDINHDLRVDMRDVGRAARAYDAELGHERWNPHADITGTRSLVPDGKVDMRDIGLIARYFGLIYS
jgi:parallel beta-helix repeat protein